MDELGLTGKTTLVLRSLDKLDKLGAETVKRELEAEQGVPPRAVEAIFAFAAEGGDPEDVLTGLRRRFAAHAGAQEGIERLATVVAGLRTAGVPSQRYRLDLGLARGLDYYTGTIYETVLDDEPEVGSICSGGRYDNLASLYTRDQLPGVGASLGLDRLLDALERLGLSTHSGATAQVLVAVLDRGRWLEYLRMAEEIRAQGVPTELYLDERRLDRQLQYADRKGIPLVVIAGEDEIARGTVAVKDLRSGEQESGVARPELARAVARALARGAGARGRAPRAGGGK
jgi:histidyl-tRNA synthetase